MLPSAALRTEYLKAFAEIVSRIQRSVSPGAARTERSRGTKSTPQHPAAMKAKGLPATKAEGLPIAMYVAGGAAQLFYTGARVSEDIDASFSRRILLPDNQSTYIPIGVKHRLENPGKTDLEIIEVQTGGYLGEDDIVRFEDTYGRVAAAK